MNLNKFENIIFNLGFSVTYYSWLGLHMLIAHFFTDKTFFRALLSLKVAWNITDFLISESHDSRHKDRVVNSNWELNSHVGGWSL